MARPDLAKKYLFGLRTQSDQIGKASKGISDAALLTEAIYTAFGQVQDLKYCTEGMCARVITYWTFNSEFLGALNNIYHVVSGRHFFSAEFFTQVGDQSFKIFCFHMEVGENVKYFV